jgi:hypothetical protein
MISNSSSSDISLSGFGGFIPVLLIFLCVLGAYGFLVLASSSKRSAASRSASAASRQARFGVIPDATRTFIVFISVVSDCSALCSTADTEIFMSFSFCVVFRAILPSRHWLMSSAASISSSIRFFMLVFVMDTSAGVSPRTVGIFGMRRCGFQIRCNRGSQSWLCCIRRVQGMGTLRLCFVSLGWKPCL